MSAHLVDLRRYPVKSLAGESLGTTAVEPWGLAGDRRWMVVEPDGGFVTARGVPRLLVVDPTITDDGLRLATPGADPIDVTTPDPAQQVPVRIWRSSLTCADAGDAAAAWLSAVLDRPVRLVHLDDPTRRATSPEFSRPEDRVSLADGYPLLVTTTASLDALRDAAGVEVPMDRFRTNLVVDGTDPWAEDTWRRVRVGDVTFRAVKGCARCVMTTLEPDLATGQVAKGPEPLRTLARTRRFGSGVWFGVNLVPDLGEGDVRLSVGDEVEVLEAVEPGTPPLGS